MATVKEYVKEVLKDLREAKDEEESFMGIRGVVHFDLATVATESGGAGVKVTVFGIGGEAGGNLQNSATSRVQFSVHTRGAIAAHER